MPFLIKCSLVLIESVIHVMIGDVHKQARLFHLHQPLFVMVLKRGRLPHCSQHLDSKRPNQALHKSMFQLANHEAHIHMPMLPTAVMRAMMLGMQVTILNNNTPVRHQCLLALVQCHPLLVRSVLRQVKQVSPMAVIFMVKT